MLSRNKTGQQVAYGKSSWIQWPLYTGELCTGKIRHVPVNLQQCNENNIANITNGFQKENHIRTSFDHFSMKKRVILSEPMHGTSSGPGKQDKAKADVVPNLAHKERWVYVQHEEEQDAWGWYKVCPEKNWTLEWPWLETWMSTQSALLGCATFCPSGPLRRVPVKTHGPASWIAAPDAVRNFVSDPISVPSPYCNGMTVTAAPVSRFTSIFPPPGE